ncbi:hypothetical protein HanPI659440_Chr04g0163611 [Helianthus annuus]|nr:hypothetical protein HanPI659440_Chr04g0163611 [Helianthus annuus]
MDNPLRLTDNSLKSLAQNCTQLESVSLSFSDEEFPSLSSFSLDGILSLITLPMCPVKSLFLDRVYSFNNTGMDNFFFLITLLFGQKSFDFGNNLSVPICDLIFNF